jgi:hypothetical protein
VIRGAGDAGPARRPRAMWDRNAGTVAAVFLVSVLATSYGYFSPFGGWNANSRLSLVFAVVDDGTLNIDAYHDAPLTLTGDKSFHRGHYYSDKAIGTAVLGVLAYAPVSAERAVSSPSRYAVTRHWITFFSVGLPVVAAVTYLFLVLDRLALGRRAALGIALVAGLATPLWPYATVLFGHALVAASLIAAFLMVTHHRHAHRPWTPVARVCFGSLLGLSVITEFPVVPVAASLSLYYLFAARERRELARVQTWLLPAVGALPLVSLQLAYNALCFGSPFSFGYGHIADPHFRAMHARGLLGVGLPSLEVLYYITLHPIRGIFLHSPVLGAGLVGLLLGAWQSRWRAEAVTCLLVVALVLLINAGYGAWWGGFAFTARHAIPAIPFLVVGLAFLPRRAWPIVAALALVSMAQMLVAVVGGPRTSDEELLRRLSSSLGAVATLGSPLWSQIWPALLADPQRFASNIGRTLGLVGFASLIPYGLAITALTLTYGGLSRTRRAPAP